MIYYDDSFFSNDKNINRKIINDIDKIIVKYSNDISGEILKVLEKNIHRKIVFENKEYSLELDKFKKEYNKLEKYCKKLEKENKKLEKENSYLKLNKDLMDWISSCKKGHKEGVC